MIDCSCGKRAVCYAPEPLCLLCATAYYTALVHIGAELSRERVRAAAAFDAEVAAMRAVPNANRQRLCVQCQTETRATAHGVFCAQCLYQRRRHALKSREA